MNKWEVLETIMQEGIIAVIRSETKEKAIKVAEALKKGGIKILEITMTVPGSIDIIKELSEKYKSQDIIIGAGTVLDRETSRLSILSGARFIVSPHLDIEIIKLCNIYKIPVIPGISSVKDIIKALEYGVDIMKLFPGEIMGLQAIKAFKGPIPQADFIPTGGVNLNNLKDWIKAGAVAVGVGSNLTKGQEEENYELIEKTAEEYVKEVKRVKAQMKI
jgi:2-dehydro-3-deoxyphosphogluconate aldolase/(4S)-4-hydroxy-2-oxoglutarate aldolase|nr:bifunctional 2-keto-4-hydroxyglutarate aldolase/2-keto-3-deoxy-6-phosphogluconate aldolase [Thermoanaerobacter mathranii]